jgi:hypothetical protein
MSFALKCLESLDREIRVLDKQGRELESKRLRVLDILSRRASTATPRMASRC